MLRVKSLNKSIELGSPARGKKMEVISVILRKYGTFEKNNNFIINMLVYHAH